MGIASLFRKVSQQPGTASPPHHYRERAVSEDWLFHGKDEVGREGWFVRIEVTGMYSRRYGPFATQAEACELLEDFLHDLVEPFGNLERDLDRPEQTCVIEGAPAWRRHQGSRKPGQRLQTRCAANYGVFRINSLRFSLRLFLGNRSTLGAVHTLNCEANSMYKHASVKTPSRKE